MNLFVPDPRVEVTQQCARQLQRMTLAARALVRCILSLLLEAADAGADFEQFQNMYCQGLPGSEEIRQLDQYGFRLIFQLTPRGINLISVEFGPDPPNQPRPQVVYIASQGSPYVCMATLYRVAPPPDDDFLITMSASSAHAPPEPEVEMCKRNDGYKCYESKIGVYVSDEADEHPFDRLAAMRI